MNTHFKILVPVDFSEVSIEALFAAAEMAKKLGARIIVLHVVDFVAGSPFFLEGSIPEENRDIMLDLRIARERDLDKLMEDERLRGLSIRSSFVMGVPDREIVERAKRYKVNLIVMSTHGRTGISHFLLGSVAEQVIRKASCPVLMFNPSALSAFGKGKQSLVERLEREILK